ncbi:MAG: FAD-dependent oxidoreductase [Armatimonadota bacterium]
MSAGHVSVIGAGLAGSAAALAAEAAGARVTLYEQRPATQTTIHDTALPGELTGASDLGVEDLDRATGLLKAELRSTCPAIMECADEARIGEETLRVDRARFATTVAECIEKADGIELVREEIRTLPDGPVVVASGPGTWSPLARAIHRAADTPFHFSFIGRPPLVAAESMDLSSAAWEEPYPGAEPALFLPLTAEEAEELTRRLSAADDSEPPGFDDEMVLAEESVPVERLAADPQDGLRRVLQGPRGPETTIEPPALCLTPDDAGRTAYHLDGLVTALPSEDQRNALSAVNALAEVQILRPGCVQRTPWLAGREATLASLQLRRVGRVLLAGALTGAWGYAEAMALGAVAGIGATRLSSGAEPLPPPAESLTGALCRALSELMPHADGRMLQANFGMIPEHSHDRGLEKPERREQQQERALKAIENYAGAD